jgi:hypothetical protein
MLGVQKARSTKSREYKKPGVQKPGVQKGMSTKSREYTSLRELGGYN